MTKVFLAVLAVIGGALWPGAATSATSERMQPMQIAVFRDARPDCAPHCLEWIGAEGQIVRGTASAFARVLRKLGGRRLPVFVDSIGGSVEDAIDMGRLIRARRLEVVVTRSIAACAKDAKEKDCAQTAHDENRLATAQGRGAVCASSCVFLLAGGVRRSAAPWTLVGVHQLITTGTRIWKQRLFRVLTRRIGHTTIIVDRQLVRERQISSEPFTEKASNATYARVRAYFSDMGVKASLMPLLLATPHEKIHWLTEDEQRATDLVTDLSDGPSLEDEASRTMAVDGQSSRLASSRPEEAMLNVHVSGAAPVTTTRGRVVWELVQTKTSSANPAPPALKAVVELARDKIQLVFSPETPVSDRIAPGIDVDVNFDLAAGSRHKIERLSPLLVQSETTTTSLNGNVRATGATSFKMVLDATPSSPNRKLLTESRWIVMPVAVDGMRFVDILIEIDASANPIMKQAFAAWAETHTAPVAGTTEHMSH